MLKLLSHLRARGRAGLLGGLAVIGITLSCDSPTEPPPDDGGSVTASRELSTITAAPSSIVANGTSTATITVQLRQSDGAAFTKSGGAVVLNSTGGTIGAVTDNNNGTYTATLTSPVTIGSATISGTLAGAALADTAGITFTSGPPAQLTIANAAANSQTAVAGSTVAIPPSVKVTDAHSNPVQGLLVTFSIGTGGGSLTGATQTTDANGVATVGSWRLGPNPGPNTLIATVTVPPSIGTSLAADLTITFTATAVAPAPTGVVINGGNNQTAIAGTAVATPPSVKVTDDSGNPVSGISVTFTVASGGGSITGSTPTSDANGIATVGSWTLGPSTGTNTLTARLTSGSGSVTFTATATSGTAGAIAIVAGDGQTGTAGTALPVAPSVKVVDGNNNPVSGATVLFAVASGGGSIASPTQTTNSSGIATAGAWTLGTVAGPNTLTASVSGSGLTPATFTATGIHGAPSVMTVNGGNGQSAMVGTALATPPSVKITDANGNPISGVAVTFAVSLGGGAVTGASTETNASGIATIGSWTLGATPGPNQLRVTSGSLAAVLIDATATAAPPPAPTITIAGGNNQTAVAGAAVATAPSVKLTDPSNNPVAGITVVFAVASGGGSITGATQTTNASGIATVGSWTLGKTAGANTLIAAVTGANGSPVTFTATGVTGPAAIIAVNVGNNQTAGIGAQVSVPPSVKVTDANGNPVGGVAVTFAVASGGGSITGGSQTTNADGIAAVGSWTLGAAGTNTLTASSSGLSGSPVTFTATAIAPGIVFEKLDNSNWDIWRVNLDGTGLRRLTTHTAEDHHPSAAGTKVYFTSVRDGNAELYVLDTATGVESRLTNTPDLQENEPQISPNGQRLTFIRGPTGVGPRAYYSDADAVTPILLAPNFNEGAFDFNPAWSQNSEKIAFTSNAGLTNADIFVVTPGTPPGSAPAFNSSTKADVQATWGPDGRLAFLSNRISTSLTELFIVDLNSGVVTRVGTGNISDPTWLPNGKIVYATYNGGIYSLHWIDPANPSDVHDINTGTGSARYPSAIFP